jgi:bifunctional DNase/RNase
MSLSSGRFGAKGAQVVLESESTQKRVTGLKQIGFVNPVYIEMAIDSTRHAKYRDEWVILLKEKDGNRYLPVYVDKDSAQLTRKALKGERGDDTILNDNLEKMLANDDEISLVIDGYEKGIFQAEFITGWRSQSAAIKCSIGKILALCARAKAQIFVSEAVLSVAGIATKPRNS